MAKVLILMLGKGQAKLIENKGDKSIDYRTANYINPNDNTVEKTTAFVGEAIISLYGSSNKKFDKAYILGTPDSMWHTLYGHCINEKIDEDDRYLEVFEQMGNAVQNRSIDDNLLKEIGDEFSQLTNVKTTCKVIPLGVNSDELWSIFETIVNIPNDNDEISIDITHGLRFQPFFLMLAIAYFQNVKNDVKIENVFYGALELSSNFPVIDESSNPVYEKDPDGSFKEFRGRMIPKVHSPIYDLKPMLDILDWIKAANAFKEYGDMTDLIKLLSPKDEKDISKNDYQLFIQRTRKFIDALQLNKISSIKNSANNFIAELHKITKIKDNKIKPIALVKDTLLEFPKTIVKPQIKNWEILLQIAKRYKDNGQIGFSVLSTWEAIVNRIALVYEFDLQEAENNNGYKYYQFCAKIARKDENKTILNNDLYYGELVEFPKKTTELSDMRNAIAHLRGKGDYSIEDIPKKFLGIDGLFSYFCQNLPNHRFNKLKEIIVYKY